MAEYNDLLEFGIDLPSLIPLQAAPQSQEQVIPYLMSLHNYLGGDRAKIARAIQVLAAFRTVVVDTKSSDELVPQNSRAQRLNVDTGLLEYDSNAVLGYAAWNPVNAGSNLTNPTGIYAEPVMVPGGPGLVFGDDVVVPSATPTTVSLVDQEASFMFTVDGDILMVLMEI